MIPVAQVRATGTTHRPYSDLLRALQAPEQNTQVTMAPDGSSVAYVHAASDGPEIWIAPVDGCPRRLQPEYGATLTDLRWSVDGSKLLYRRAERGRESWQLRACVAPGRTTTIEAPGSVVEYWLSVRKPDAALLSVRHSGQAWLYRLDLCEPSAARAVAGPAGYHRWLVDADLRPRGGIRMHADGCATIEVGEVAEHARPMLRIDAEDRPDLDVIGFDATGRLLYLLSSSGAPVRRLVALNTRDGQIQVVYEHDSLDIQCYPITDRGVSFDPRTGMPDLVSVMDSRLIQVPLTSAMAERIGMLDTGPGQANALVDRSCDDSVWLIGVVHDNGPLEYRQWEPATGRTRSLLLNRPDLKEYRMPSLREFSCVAGDGLPLTGYLLTPLSGTGPWPTVVMVHGGPGGRDLWRFHADAQYLAALGYASIHLNYRGSAGLGRRFRVAANGEWGRKMQTDLYDAVRFAIAERVADAERIAFFGFSYGGYAALLAATSRPDMLRCAVAVSPPTDLASLALDPPPYWRPLAGALRRQILGAAEVADADMSAVQRAVRDRSPRTLLSARTVPLLIAQGALDPRVPVADIDQFVERCRSLGVPVRYLRFPDEGHNIRAAGNRLQLFAEIESFLEVHL
jgi:dipeptidyl aminopeptidase/acylaminoacyl peptidase